MRREPLPRQRVSPGLRNLLATLDHVPAMVQGRRTDVLACNTLVTALYAGFTGRNLARFILLDPAAKDLYPEWPEVARSVVAVLRLYAGAHPDDPELTPLVDELTRASALFRQVWNEHAVVRHADGRKRFRHPVVGELTLNYETFTAAGDPEQTLIMFHADPDSPSADALRLSPTPHGLSSAYPETSGEITVKAVRVTRYGTPDVLDVAELPVPTPGEGEVAIDVTHAAVGLVDVLIRRGDFAGHDLPMRPPYTPGIEAAGTVRAVGAGVTTLRPGDRVATLSIITGGGYAEVMTAPAAAAFRLPDGVAPARALAALPNATTAVLALTRAVTLPDDARVLVLGATGALASVFPAIAKRLGAREVVGTVRSPARIAEAEKLASTGRSSWTP